MANTAPGVYVNVTAAGPNPTLPASTGNWFVTGLAAGPANTAFPIRSLNDFITYFGQIVNGQVTGRYVVSAAMSSLTLYDALDEFFHDGGNTAYVSRIQPTSTGVAAVSSAIGNAWQLTANGKGTWANSSGANASGIIVTITGYTVGSQTVYSASIASNGTAVAATNGLLTDTDFVNWVQALQVGAGGGFITAAAQAQTSTLPVSGSSITIYLTTGTDVAIVDADMPVALTAFTALLGPGQVSYPGGTSSSNWNALTTHAIAFNRVAYLDAPNTASAATIETQVSSFQAASTDSSYAAVFAPWVIIPGVVNTNASTLTSPVFNRTVAPSAYAAALAAANDANSDANSPAAGLGFASTYITGVSQTYVQSDLANLNADGISVIRQIPTGQFVLWGFRSTAFNPAWTYLNNVRMRMQIVFQAGNLAENFVFQEIDPKGKLFARLNGALSGLMLGYYQNGSLYGATSNLAYQVNTGPSVNTINTIAAGAINANIAVKLSPFAETVTINITKYNLTTAIPA
jgi:phage tail sheath protein FI